jgi:hypothetical protein
MEFVIVTFPTTRNVRVDGSREGQTGQIIGVQRGRHIFDLGNPRDYLPPSVEVPVFNTTPGMPLAIAFHPTAFAGGGVAMAPAALAAGKKKAAKKKGAGKKKKPAAKPRKTRKKSGAKRGKRKVR